MDEISTTPVCEQDREIHLMSRKSSSSLMSSSLKDRLKRCGRYHPATPPSSQKTTSHIPNQQTTSTMGLENTHTSSLKKTSIIGLKPLSPASSHQNTSLSQQQTAVCGLEDSPVSSQQKTPVSGPHNTPTSIPQMISVCGLRNTLLSNQQQISPFSSRQNLSTLDNDASNTNTRGLKRKLPHPRNIFVEAVDLSSSVIETSCEIEKESLALWKAGNNVCIAARSKKRTAKDNVTVSSILININETSRQAMSDRTCDVEDCDVASSQNMGRELKHGVPRAGRNGQSISTAGHDTSVGEIGDCSGSNPLPRGSTYRPDGVSISQSAGDCSVVCATNDGCPDKDLKEKTDTSLEDLHASKTRLSAELTRCKEVLRKLQMVRTYRGKNDLEQLQVLIDKWRSVCQKAVLDLQQLTPDPRPSLTQLVQQLGIDCALVQYDDVEECFDMP